MPQRPDVTKMAPSIEEPFAKLPKFSKDPHKRGHTNLKESDNTDHIAEITQLRERIASLQKTVEMKNREIIAKQVSF